MRGIHYDAEGDILSVVFAESSHAGHTGIELADNIVLYYNPETDQPPELILVSYQALVRASEQRPIRLDRPGADTGKGACDAPCLAAKRAPDCIFAGCRWPWEDNAHRATVRDLHAHDLADRRSELICSTTAAASSSPPARPSPCTAPRWAAARLWDGNGHGFY